MKRMSGWLVFLSHETWETWESFLQSSLFSWCHWWQKIEFFFWICRSYRSQIISIGSFFLTLSHVEKICRFSRNISKWLVHDWPTIRGPCKARCFFLLVQIAYQDSPLAEHGFQQRGEWLASKKKVPSQHKGKAIGVFPKILGFPPKSSSLLGFSMKIHHPFLGYHYFWKHP